MQAEAMLMAPAPDRSRDEVAEATPARAMSEPATARALWPTFMRRTLAEDLLRREAPRPRG